MLASSAGRSSRSISVRRAGIDGREAPGEATEISRVRIDRLPADIFEQVIVQVHPVERGVRRVGFVKVREVFVDKMR